MWPPARRATITPWRDCPYLLKGVENMKKHLLFFLSFSLVFGFYGTAMAQHGGHGGSTSSSTEKGASHSMPAASQAVQSATVEGYKITFEVMDMSAHMSMPGMKGETQHGASDHSKSHALMVKVQDTASKEIISDAKVQYALVRPSGEKETGKLAWSGDHYAGTFSPKEKGTYQVQLKIESGGMERDANFKYQAK
jgi:hypothetical protein